MDPIICTSDIHRRKYFIVIIKKFAHRKQYYFAMTVGILQTLRAQCITTRVFKYLIYSADLDRILPRLESFIHHFIKTTLTIKNDCEIRNNL